MDLYRCIYRLIIHMDTPHVPTIYNAHIVWSPDVIDIP